MASADFKIKNFFSGGLESVILSIEEDKDDERDMYFQSVVASIEKIDIQELHICDDCGKTYKTSRGLYRHQKQKHGDIPLTSEENINPSILKNLSEKSATKLAEETYYPDNIISQFKSFVMTISQAEKIHCQFDQVMKKYASDAEKFYPKFYKIVGTITEFGNLSKHAITLIGFELANQVMAYLAKKSCTEENITNSSSFNNKIISKREASIIAYLSGYVFSNIYRKIRNSNLVNSVAAQEKLALLKAGRSEEISDDCYSLVNTKNRGGLWYVNANVIGIFTITENIFREETIGDIRCIDSDQIVNKVMCDGRVKSYYSILQEEAGILVGKETATNLLEQLILLYVQVRSHSLAKKKIELHKLECKAKKARSLRTEMKRSDQGT